MQDYRKLEVWQMAHRLTVDVYVAVAHWRGPATWAIAEQVRHAAISVPFEHR